VSLALPEGKSQKGDKVRLGTHSPGQPGAGISPGGNIQAVQPESHVSVLAATFPTRHRRIGPLFSSAADQIGKSAR